MVEKKTDEWNVEYYAVHLQETWWPIPFWVFRKLCESMNINYEHLINHIDSKGKTKFGEMEIGKCSRLIGTATTADQHRLSMSLYEQPSTVPNLATTPVPEQEAH